MTDKIGNGSIPLRIGNLINTTVYGGPYLDVPVDYWGVKMAVEIDHPHMVSVPTKDFDVPKVSDLQAGIVKSLMAMINEEDVYVGCMGGIGRTGLFLAALAKVQIEYRRSKHRKGRGDDPVLYVREHFISHAVETKQQMEYIKNLDVSDIVNWLNMTQVAMGLNIGYKVADDDVYAGPFQTIYDDHEEVPPDFAKAETLPGGAKPAWIPESSKIDNPAFDKYSAEWKTRIPTMAMRDVDFVVDRDSADDSPEPWAEDYQEQLDSLQNQIDEIDEGAQVMSERIDIQVQKLDVVIDWMKKILTNPSIFAKIRGYFR